MQGGAFDDDRAWWGQSLAAAHWDFGDRTRAPAYADSALPASEAQYRANPTDASLAGAYALMLAYDGRGAEATDKMAEALRRANEVRDGNEWYITCQALRIDLIMGRTEAALEKVPLLLNSRNYTSAAWMRLDPLFNPLRGNPRFEAQS